MKKQPQPKIRWRQIVVCAGLLAGIAAIALVVPIASHAIKEYLELAAAKPRPVPAPPEDFRNIVRELTHGYGFDGTPPPPPFKPRPIVLAASSIWFCPTARVGSESIDRCQGSHYADDLTGVGLNSEISLKLRQELVAANVAPHAVPDPGTPRAILAGSEEIEMLSCGPGAGRRFYSRYPANASVLKVSTPVLSSGGTQALLYAEEICLSGRLILLRRHGASWKIEKNLILWIS